MNFVEEDFSLNKILSIKTKKEREEKIYINSLLQGIETRIKFRKERNCNDLLYEVPNITIGLPLYDSSILAKILTSKLIELGYKTKNPYTNQIYIYWNPKEKIYPHIPILLNRIKRKIEITASEKNQDCCIYELPPFIPGLPLYDNGDASIMLKTNLSDEGFVIKIMYNSQIYISWNLQDIEKKESTEIYFKTKEERRKEDKEKITQMNMSKYEKFKNSDKISYSALDLMETESYDESPRTEDFDSYFDMESVDSEIKVNYNLPPSRRLPEQPSYKFQTSEYKANSNSTDMRASVLCPEPSKSRVKFFEKKQRKRPSKEKLFLLSNPDKTGRSRKLDISSSNQSSGMSSNQDILKSLEKLKKEAKKSSFNRMK
jgi:hypothetical protein